MDKSGIVLIGMAGVGKSTIGRSLASALGREFIDLDVYLIRQAGKTPQQIIDEQGEPALLELEKSLILELRLSGRVISPGGSIIYDKELMSNLKKRAWLIYLDDSFENIEKRIKNAPTRGIIGMKSKTLLEIYKGRQPLYAGYADITVDLRHNTREEAVQEITAQLPGDIIVI